jgi:maltoporin
MNDHDNKQPRFTHAAACRRSGIALAAAMLCGAALAQPIDFNGYIRAGVGSNSNRGQQTCFGLAGAGGKYRLGNECDFFTEVSFGYTLPQASDGATFKAVLMPGYQIGTFNGDSNNESITPYLRQAYVEGSAIPELGGATVWAGRRFYKRNNYYPMDFYYWNDALTGGGIDNVALGSVAKLSYALSRANGAGGVNDAVTRHEFQLSDIAAGPGGKFTLGLSLVGKDSSNPGTRGGYALSVQQTQSLGGAQQNKLTLQYGRGGAVEVGFVANHGVTAHGDDDTRQRLVDELFVQLTANLSGQANAIYQRDRFASGNQTWTSFGSRLNYAFTQHVKLVADVGRDSVAVDGAPTRHLSKMTIAPAISMGRNYWDRPSIYLYATYAKWNDAARVAAKPGSTLSAGGPFGSANNGYTLGTQLEAWW